MIRIYFNFSATCADSSSEHYTNIVKAALGQLTLIEAQGGLVRFFKNNKYNKDKAIQASFAQIDYIICEYINIYEELS